MLMATLLVIASLLPQNAFAQRQRKAVIQEIADVLSMGIREIIGERVQRRAVAADTVMAAPAMPIKPLEHEINKRKNRVNAYCNAMQQWIAEVCELDEKQKAGLKEIVDKEIAKSQSAWEKRDANQQNQPLADTFPIKFTIRYGTAQSLDMTRHYKKLNDLLTEDQMARLKKATSQRRDVQIEAMVNRVLNMLDEELYLSRKQREEMFEPLKKRLTGMESSSFSFHGQSHYYQQQSIAFLLQRGDHLKGLNDAQRRRAKDLASMANNNSYNAEQYILFNSNDGTDGWYRKLEESAKEQRERVYRACAVRSEFYLAEWDLPEKATRHLTVAGKGIADSVIVDWKKTVRQQLKAYEEQAGRFGGNFSFSMQVVDLKKIETNKLWLHTVDRLNPNKDTNADVYNRNEMIRRKQAQFLTAALDRELWLRPEQLPKVEEMVEKILPTEAWHNPYRNYMDEIALLVIPLFKFSKRDATVFEGPQKKAWETLKGEFDYNGRYVMVHMKNGGQFHFMMPK